MRVLAAAILMAIGTISMTTISSTQLLYSGQPTSIRNQPLAGLSLNDVLVSSKLSREILEMSRWPAGPICIRCKAPNKACRVTSRPGLWTCKACRNCQYTVTSHTPLHGTRVDIHKWARLFCFRKIWNLSISCTDLSQHLSVSYLTTRRMIQKVEEMETVMPMMTERLINNLHTLNQHQEK